MSPTRLLITSGRGPQECELVVRHLATRIQGQAESAGLVAEIEELEQGAHPRGARSLILALRGRGSAEFAAPFAGPTCWQATSPLRPQHRRKNWFVDVSVMHDAPAAAQPVHESNVRFEPVRGSGPGGQHRNKVATGVRATHLPTGTVVTATDSRSAQANRRAAVDRIAAQLAQSALAAGRQQRHDTWQQHDTVLRGTPADEKTHRITEPLTVP